MHEISCTARGVSRFHHRLHRIPSTHGPPIFGFFNFSSPKCFLLVFKKSITSATLCNMHSFLLACFLFVFFFSSLYFLSVWWTIMEDTHRYSSKTCLFSFQIAALCVWAFSLYYLFQNSFTRILARDACMWYTHTLKKRKWMSILSFFIIIIILKL